MFDITLIHPPSGERKVVPVEFVATNLSYVTIRWELAGIYDLNLKVNVLTPRSTQVQVKGRAKWYKKDRPLWKAEDIVAVRKMAADYIAEKQGKPRSALAESIERHTGSMPGANPRIGLQDIADEYERDVVQVWGVTAFPSYTGDPETD